MLHVGGPLNGTPFTGECKFRAIRYPAAYGVANSFFASDDERLCVRIRNNPHNMFWTVEYQPVTTNGKTYLRFVGVY